MNIQDIADFIDLVKNPAKFERFLKQLQEENDRRITVIETVGKVSEINDILAKTKKEQENVGAQLEQQRAALQTAKEIQEREIAKLKEKTKELLDEAKAKNKVAVEREKLVSEKLTEIESRITDLEQQRISITNLKTVLEERNKDLAEKQEKLKSILG